MLFSFTTYESNYFLFQNLGTKPKGSGVLLL